MISGKIYGLRIGILFLILNTCGTVAQTILPDAPTPEQLFLPIILN